MALTWSNAFGLGDIWEGVTSTVAGLGKQVGAAADATRAAAANIAANEESEQRILAANKAREGQLLMLLGVVMVVAVGLPMAVILSKK